jgi:hypothetical protein
MSSALRASRRAVAFLALLAVGACHGGGGGANGGPGVPTPTISTGPETSVALSRSTVDVSGGTVAVADAASPLHSLSIAVPPGAASETVTFTVTSADVTGVSGLPEKSRVVGRVITIQTSGSEAWNRTRSFRLPVKVTIPYAPPERPDDILNVYSVEPDGTLEPTGFESQDETAHTLTFFTRTFASASYDPSHPASGSQLRATGPRSSEANTAAAGQVTFARYLQVYKDSSLWQPGHVLSTDFAPAKHGWYIPNEGSYVTSEGNCFGMTSFAKWYFKRGFSPTLVESYRDPQKTARWPDDATAIELATRVQVGMNDAYKAYSSYEIDVQRSATRVMAATLGALYDTKAPVLLQLNEYAQDPEGRLRIVGVGHTLLAYQADIGDDAIDLHVYDPNHPRSADHFVRFVRGKGFDPYGEYNAFRMAYFAIGMSGGQMLALKREADLGFKDDTWFPTVTITSIAGENNGETVYDRASGVAKEGVTANGEHKFVTTDRGVVIRGTVLGGKTQDPCCALEMNAAGVQECVSCVVDHGFLSYHGSKIEFDIDNRPNTGDGSFEVEVPLVQGERGFAIVAANTDYSEWAAFHRDVLESPWNAALEVSLGWTTPAVDLDLYVKEPDQPAPGTKKGDTVYYSHRSGVDVSHPFLDIDMQHGPGNEHYRAENGTRSRYTDGSDAADLYGTYTARVHYYADHSGKRPPQTATFTLGWRYMAFCPDPCSDPVNDGTWIVGTATESLSGPSSANCCDVGASGPNWSTPVTITYKKPDSSQWRIPTPSEVMAP